MYTFYVVRFYSEDISETFLDRYFTSENKAYRFYKERVNYGCEIVLMERLKMTNRLSPKKLILNILNETSYVAGRESLHHYEKFAMEE